MLKSGICNYNDAYILVKGTTTITGTLSAADAAGRLAGKRIKGVKFKSCVLFTDWIIEINNTERDNAKGLDKDNAMFWCQSIIYQNIMIRI